MRLHTIALRSPILIAALGVSVVCHAGRPSTVDDAGSNEPGKGHLELWAAREADKVNTVNVAPAFGLLEGLEIGALFSRESSSDRSRSAVQFKWIVTPSNENGCNVGLAGGTARWTKPTERANFAVGLFTCNGKGVGSVHLNVGVEKPTDARSVRTWGIAFERELDGVTPHIEFFGAQESKTTAQIGLRGEVAKALQLDGTLARVKGETLFSVGLKWQF